MKTIQELQQLRDELKLAYETVLANPDTNYDKSTITYALKCFQDAEKVLNLALITPGYLVAEFKEK